MEILDGVCRDFEVGGVIVLGVVTGVGMVIVLGVVTEVGVLIV